MTTQTTQTRDIAASIDGSKLTLSFRHGETIIIDRLVLDSEIVDQATMHGLKQKLVDAAAISRNPATGATATIEDKYQAVLAVYNRLLDGEWNKQREAGESAGSTGLLFRALCRLYPAKSSDTIRTYLDGKTKSEQAALRANPKIAAIIDTIRAEKSRDIDADSLLAELDD